MSFCCGRFSPPCTCFFVVKDYGRICALIGSCNFSGLIIPQLSCARLPSTCATCVSVTAGSGTLVKSPLRSPSSSELLQNGRMRVALQQQQHTGRRHGARMACYRAYFQILITNTVIRSRPAGFTRHYQIYSAIYTLEVDLSCQMQNIIEHFTTNLTCTFIVRAIRFVRNPERSQPCPEQHVIALVPAVPCFSAALCFGISFKRG